MLAIGSKLSFRAPLADTQPDATLPAAFNIQAVQQNENENWAQTIIMQGGKRL
jgi:hypothetical protein